MLRQDFDLFFQRPHLELQSITFTAQLLVSLLEMSQFRVCVLDEILDLSLETIAFNLEAIALLIG
jgi:hypothetical protein